HSKILTPPLLSYGAVRPLFSWSTYPLDLGVRCSGHKKPSDFLHGAQLGRTRPGVYANLIGGWHYGPLGQERYLSTPATLADRRSRRAKTGAVTFAKGIFD